MLIGIQIENGSKALRIENDDVIENRELMTIMNYTSNSHGIIKPGAIVRITLRFQLPQFLTRSGHSQQSGKIVNSFENPKSLSGKTAPTNPPLGRSLSRWMLKRGARHFAFLGRTGDDRQSTREVIKDLRRGDAQVYVTRGDVLDFADAQAFVDAYVATRRPIRGAVQAALGLHEDLFSRMSNTAWHTAVPPKWKGTWKLHNALQHHEDALDFFVLLSSVSGSVATATESNYCAANGFLNARAKWRRKQGKKAVSVGLGMISGIGYLHENPDIEALLLRKGIQPLNEEGFDVTSGNMANLRLAVLSASLLAGTERSGKRGAINGLLIDINLAQGLNHYGVDSMIAAEFRTWIWNTFKVDVSF
ncbi:KR domain-containing protein [Xylaria palmicola]|nr:KR domain-containing protein [Xylaria palmicola]